MPTMQLVERHRISPKDPRWAAIDNACWLSKNLYNATLYFLRQHFFATGKTLAYAILDKELKQQSDYCALPRKVSQWVLQQVSNDWQNFWSANQEYQKTPSKFTGRPNLPRYKDIEKGRNLLVYTYQAISRLALRK